MSFRDYASGISLADCSKLAINWKNDNDVTICMSISLLVMELWRLSFIRDWPEIQKSEIPSSEFWWISGQPQCPDIRDTKFHKMSLMKCYWMVQNTRVTAFYRFWVIIFWVINSGDKFLVFSLECWFIRTKFFFHCIFSLLSWTLIH